MKFIWSWVRALALFSFLVSGSQLYAGLPKCFVFPEVHNTTPGEFYYIVPDPDASPLPEATVITMDRAFGSEGSAYRPLTQTYYAIDEDRKSVV